MKIKTRTVGNSAIEGRNKFIEDPVMLGAIGHIAKNIFFIETLDPANSDKLDFRHITAGDIRLALKLAYMAGVKDSRGSAL